MDASPSGARAAGLAAHLAFELGCQAVLAHVESPADPARHAGVASLARARELGRLRALTEQLPFPDGALVRLAAGDPATELSILAESHDAQLVVLGGVSGGLIRTAPCPVVLAPSGGPSPAPGSPIGPVVCGLAGEARDRDLLRLGADLARRLGGSIRAVRAPAHRLARAAEEAGAGLIVVLPHAARLVPGSGHYELSAHAA